VCDWLVSVDDTRSIPALFDNLKERSKTWALITVLPTTTSLEPFTPIELHH
jgi:hypothetical protein